MSHACRGIIVALVMMVVVCPLVLAGTFDADTTAVPVDEQTSTSYGVGQPEIQQLPTRGVKDVVVLQPGVVIDRRYGEVHIRGGGASDADYYVDGISQRDGFTGSPTAVVSNNMLETITLEPGAFGAEYGNVTSGVVSAKTIDGGSELHGTLEAATDNFHGDNYDYNIYSVALNGPLIPNSDKLTFSAAAERLWFGHGRWNWQGKLRWKPSDKVTARVGTLGSDADWQTIPRAYLFDYEHAPRTTLNNNSVWGEITHAPNEHVWYSFRGSWLKREAKTGDGVYFDNLWGYGRPGEPNSNIESAHLFWSWDDLNIDEEGNQIVTPTYDSILAVPVQGYFDVDTIKQAFVYNFTRVDSSGKDEFGNDIDYTTTFADEGSLYNNFEKYQSSSYSGRFDLVAKVASAHEVMAGAEFRRHILRYYHDYVPTRIYLGANGGFDDIDSYGYDVLGRETDADLGLNGAKHPVDLGGYLQDRIRLGDLTLNAGIRIDRFDYDAKALRDPADPLDPDHYFDLENPTDSQLVEALHLTESDLKDASTYTRFSPQLGVAIPIAPQTTVHMSAGRYHQRPDLQNLYVNFDFLEYKVRTDGYQAVLSNAALEPLRTTAYEAGIDHEISGFGSISATGFYKDIEHLLRIITSSATPNSFTTIDDQGTAIAKGLEFQVNMKRRSGVAATLNYTLQHVEGQSLYYRSQITWTTQGTYEPVAPFYYDQPHKLTAILDFRAGQDGGPKLGSIRPFNNSGISAAVLAASGFPYTPTAISSAIFITGGNAAASGPINSERAPSTFRVDLKADKMISMGRATCDFYFWILNLFDRDNVIDVYQATGLPDETGWLDTPSGQLWADDHAAVTDDSGLNGEQKYQLRQNDPNNFDTPRQIRFGARLLF